MLEATEYQERDRKPHGLFVWGAVGLALLAANMPARSDCVSPLVEDSRTTTVYLCPQGNAASRPAPVVVDPDRSTVVGRGSANIPWFEPKPTQTSDPITVPAATAPEKETVPPAKPEKRLAVPAAPPAPKEEVVTIEPVPDVAAEEKEAEPKATKAKPRTKAAAAKPIKRKPKTKVVKATRSKAKVAKAKRSQPKVAQARPAKTKIAKPEPANDQTVKTEPAKSDDRIILMTKKDMGLGSRIKNWLRF